MSDPIATCDEMHLKSQIFRSSGSQMFFKTGILKNFAKTFEVKQKACNFIKETPTQMFSCEYCDIFKNSFFCSTPLVAASEYLFHLGSYSR